jgi:tetratricopeptide (TPR) repeat protein
MTTDAAEAYNTHDLPRWSLWVGLVVLAWIAWRVLSLGQADALASREPNSALAWRSDQADALLLKAQAQLLAGDGPDAEAAARQALTANPLDGRGYRMLAEAALAKGNAADALRRYQLASQRSPRDLPSHQWLAARYLQAGDYPRLLAHIDSVLRVEPELSPQVFPDLVRLATLPAAQPALARLLLAEPPWRSGFLVQLSHKVPDVRSVAPLMERLRHAHDSLADDELAAWLERLIHDREWGAAYLTWVAQLPSEKQVAIGNVFNGGFDWEPSNSGFGWRFGRVAGAQIDRAETAGASNGFALRVSFLDQRVPFNHVRQLLALQPGPYRLDGRVRLDSLSTERGLVWSIVCAETGHELASSEAFSGNSPWRPFNMAFVVPGENCGGQWLQLHLPARIRAEERIGGVVWFDDLKISRTASPDS